MNHILAAMTVTLFASSCATLSDQREAEILHEALDATTDIVDPLYEAAALACDAAERVIVAREPASRDLEEAERADLEAIQVIRTTCNPVFAAFEDVRILQIAARQRAEQVKTGQDVPVSRAFDALNALQNAAMKALELWKHTNALLKEVIHGGSGSR